MQIWQSVPAEQGRLFFWETLVLGILQTDGEPQKVEEEALGGRREYHWLGISELKEGEQWQQTSGNLREQMESAPSRAWRTVRALDRDGSLRIPSLWRHVWRSQTELVIVRRMNAESVAPSWDELVLA